MAPRGVEEAPDLPVGLGQVHPEIASRDGHRGPDRDVGVAAPVVVEERLALVGAVPPAGDDRPGLRLRRVQDAVGGGGDGVRPDLLDELEEAALTEAYRADLGREIAEEVPGMPHVDLEEPHDVLAQLPPVVEAKGRHPEALLPDLGRRGVVGAVGRAPDVGVVRPVEGPEEEPAVREDGQARGEVRQVAPPVVGVVQHEHVARVDVVPEGVEGRDRGGGHRPHVDRDVLRLGDQLALRVGDRGREVAARVQDLGERGAEHRLSHLVHDADEAVLDHGHGDRIGGVAGCGHEMLRWWRATGGRLDRPGERPPREDIASRRSGTPLPEPRSRSGPALLRAFTAPSRAWDRARREARRPAC